MLTSFTVIVITTICLTILLFRAAIGAASRQNERVQSENSFLKDLLGK